MQNDYTVLREQIDTLKSRASAVKNEISRLKPEVEKAEALAEKSSAYRQIVNVISAHCYLMRANLQSEELTNFWSSREDICYGHDDICYNGRAAVTAHYTQDMAAMRAEVRKISNEINGTDFHGDEAPGQRITTVACSPYVEISEDYKTASGTWILYQFHGRLNLKGELKHHAAYLHCKADFVLENGAWKMLHYHDYEDVRFATELAKPFMPPDMPKDGPRKPLYNAEERKAMGCKTIAKLEDGVYDQAHVALMDPPLPKPMQTWNQADSYIQVLHDDYEF